MNVAHKASVVEIIAYCRFKPRAIMDIIQPYLRDRVANVWRLWKAGTVRENYARADVSGVVIVFECVSVEDAERCVDDFPLSKAGFRQWEFIPLDAPMPSEILFDKNGDMREPFDHTMKQ